MKTELKRFYQRAAGMLLMMLLTTTTAWATDLTDFLPVSSSGTATGYFAFSNHFFRVDWSGINTSQTSSVKLTYNSDNNLWAQRNGDTSSDISLYATSSKYAAWKTWYITDRTPGQSSDGYTSDADLATGASSNDKKKVCTITCMAANAPTWNWSADCTTCTATFTCTAYPSLTATVNATVTLSGITATASVTFNGSNYSDSKNPTYSITYVLNGGTNAAGNPSTYTAGTGVASLASPTRTGYTFDGWYDNPGFSGSAVTSISASTTGTVTLYAKWTANQYTVVYNANGGSGTMSNQTFTYDVPQQLRANTFTKTGKLFDGWKDDNNNSYTASQSVINLTATNNGTVTLYAQWKEDPNHPSGSGTENDPYIISSIEKWNTFADESNSATYWGSGTHIQLGANISGVTTMVGTNNHYFGGTFDGQGYTLSVNYTANESYCAPFKYTDDATIKKLNVAGTITTSMSRAAGLIGKAYGTTNVSDCRSSVTINSSYNGSGYHAGFIVTTYEGSTTNITNCVFDGSINFTGSGVRTKNCGGFVSTSYGNINISNSLLNATFDIDNTDCYTFTWSRSAHIENCYYITALGTVQGTQAYTARQSFPCKSATILGTTVYYAADLTPFGKTDNYSPDGSADHPYIISNANGWDYFCDALEDNTTWNRFSGKTVKLDANIGTAQDPVTRWAGSDGHEFCGNFNGGGNTLTFTVTTAADNYCAPFRNVKGGSDEDHAITISNLNVKTTITATDYRHAAGLIALQSGHVNVSGINATVNISSTVGDNNPHDLYPAALVSQASSSDGGTLTVSGCTATGTISTDGKYAAGLVGIVQGTATITDCVSSVTINSSTSGDGTHGGIVAVVNGSGTITGCVFNGKLLSKNTGNDATTNCAGFVAWGNGTISNCLYAPATILDGETEVLTGDVNNYPSGTFYRGTAPTVSNCYYTRTLGTAQGKEAHSITAGENVTVALSGTATEYNVSGITAYKDGETQLKGLKYGDVLYAGNEDEVSLTLQNTATGAPAGYSYGYTASAGTLDDNNTLTMPDQDVTVSVNTAVLTVLPWSGDGTENSPYIIYNKDQLDLLAYRVNGTHGETANDYYNTYFQLAKDISYTHKADGEAGAATESNYEAIGGIYDGNDRYFCGHFDGNNKTISGIRIYKGGGDETDMFQGIFGYTGDGAVIHDLTLANARITGFGNTGGIVGYNYGGTVTRCHVADDVAVCAVQSGAWWHGGIVGYNNGTIEQCTSAATLTTAAAYNSWYYGGIAGINYGTLRDNLAIGATVPAATNNSYGAITGRNGGSLQRNYYAACKVANTENATGVGCGYIDDGNGGYTTADVNNDNNPDGAVCINTLALAANPHDGNYWTTFYCGHTGYKIDDGENAWAYTAEYTRDESTQPATETLTLHKLGKVIPKQTAVILVGSDNEISMTASTDAPENTVSNDLHGVDVRTLKSTLGTGTFYVMGKVNDVFGFYQYKADYMPARKAYLLISGNAAPGLKMVFDDETTSLTPVPSPKGEGSDYWYTLSGTRLNAQPTQKGVYIHGNKKIVIK